MPLMLARAVVIWGGTNASAFVHTPGTPAVAAGGRSWAGSNASSFTAGPCGDPRCPGSCLCPDNLTLTTGDGSEDGSCPEYGGSWPVAWTATPVAGGPLGAWEATVTVDDCTFTVDLWWTADSGWQWAVTSEGGGPGDLGTGSATQLMPCDAEMDVTGAGPVLPCGAGCQINFQWVS